ncbi:MAG: hypothetical protein ACOCVM_00355 [Desulfovibrionaceae bacterium]
MTIYRCEIFSDCLDSDLTCHPMRRIPHNIPYLVDNLWEWRRPEAFPSRRHAIFASPTPQAARRSGQDSAALCRVDIRGEFDLCQDNEFEDARMHPECRTLPMLVLKLLGREWAEASLEEKAGAAPLWSPCLSKADVDQVIERVERLRDNSRRLWDFIHYWDELRLWRAGDLSEVELSPAGEVFFHTTGSYRLIPLGSEA